MGVEKGKVCDACVRHVAVIDHSNSLLCFPVHKTVVMKKQKVLQRNEVLQWRMESMGLKMKNGKIRMKRNEKKITKKNNKGKDNKY